MTDGVLVLEQLRVGDLFGRVLLVLKTRFWMLSLIGVVGSGSLTVLEALFDSPGALIFANAYIIAFASALCTMPAVDALRERVAPTLSSDHQVGKAQVETEVERMMGASAKAPLAGVVANVVIAFGFFALVIPGLYALAALWVVIPVAVVEKRGVRASLQRSAELTKGYRWRVLGVALLTLVMSLGVAILVLVLAEIFGGNVTIIVTEIVVTGYFIAFGAVAAAVCYHDLLLLDEGPDRERIAAVFG